MEWSRVSLFMVLGLLAPLAHGAEKWTLTNPSGRSYDNEVVRLKVDLPTDAKRGSYIAAVNGKEVPSQVGEMDGKKWLYVIASLGAGQSIEYSVEKGRLSRQMSLVSIERNGAAFVLGNDAIAVRVPAAARDGVPPPIEAVRLPNGKWVGSGVWSAGRALKRFSATVLGPGPVFAKVRLRYEFKGSAGLYGDTPAFAEIDVSVLPSQRHVVIEESHEMGRGDHWTFNCASGWQPRAAICIPHSGGFDRPDLGPWPPNTLKAGQTRMGDTLLNLMPRWTQAFDEGWFFACNDEANAVGAMAVRAGRWHWPHNNMISVKVKDDAEYAGLLCPTWKGRRVWFLVAGPRDIWADGGAKRYVKSHAFETLDKLHHDYSLDWPGVESLTKKVGAFRGKDFFDNGMNPTGAMRSFGRGAMRDVGKQGNLETLSLIQVLLGNDAYGSYWNYWSPENPNFFTDYIRGPIAMATRLKAHPRFEEFARLTEQKLREDFYHSITLPGGAGQECPGYVAHAMKSWSALAPVCKEHLGFDPSQWPRFKAGASFLLRVSQPIGEGRRRCHPGGDTHPPGPDVMDVAAQFGVEENIRQYRTEELPGFGVVFRNRPGTDKETYLAFKSGPNRGHFHGDQLSFHYCANGRPVAIDHMCSYKPRAGQEHMHNRVAFHTDRLPYANMDGYERLICFETSNDVDVAIGQVESERLRATTEYPPEGWDVYLPEQRFDEPLVYRRTVVCMKNRGQDYFVIRDQYMGPDLEATYCLHALSDRCDREGATIGFGNLSLFVAKPSDFEFGRHDWGFSREDKQGKTVFEERTKGVRLTVSGSSAEFVTVLYPGSVPPPMTAVVGGVRVGDDTIVFAGAIDDDDTTAYVSVSRDGKRFLTVTGADIDMDRSQGDIGLFVPDAGYPFGVIPDWLVKQRSAVPDWAPAWVREHRRHERPRVATPRDSR